MGGAEGTRTPDPLHAMEVRYQLRHSPFVAIAKRRSTAGSSQCSLANRAKPSESGDGARLRRMVGEEAGLGLEGIDGLDKLDHQLDQRETQARPAGDAGAVRGCPDRRQAQVAQARSGRCSR